MLYPWAITRLIDVNYQDTPRPVTDFLGAHITAAPNARSQFAWFSTPTAFASSHLHLDKWGLWEQYVDSEHVSWASGAGNRRGFNIEIQGSGAEPLTNEQVDQLRLRLPELAAQYRVPLALMVDSLPSSRGIAPHRAGVPYRRQADGTPVYRAGWLIEGGEVWSATAGKQCPGDPVIEQLRVLIPTLGQPIPKGVPVQNPFVGRLTSPFGPRGTGFHAGIDIAPPVAGTTGGRVSAAYAGTVVRVVSTRAPGETSRTNELAPYRTGNGVLVRNPDGEHQLYGHVAPAVTLGQRVEKGQLLGTTDRSGVQSGPHLHFECWRTSDPGSTRDPMIDFRAAGITPGVGAPAAAGAAPSSTLRAQQVLNTLGYGPLAEDGVQGPGGPTQTAVEAFQRDWGLLDDGQWGPKTDARAVQVLDLRQTPGLNVDGIEGQFTTAALQWRLRDLGFYRGRIDGDRGETTKAAERALLTALGYNVARPTAALQQWLRDVNPAFYPWEPDDVRGEGTVKGLQAALNAGKVTLDSRPTPQPAPEPSPQPPPAPEPAPETTPEPAPGGPALPAGIDIDALAERVATKVHARLSDALAQAVEVLRG